MVRGNNHLIFNKHNLSTHAHFSLPYSSYQPWYISVIRSNSFQTPKQQDLKTVFLSSFSQKNLCPALLSLHPLPPSQFQQQSYTQTKEMRMFKETSTWKSCIDSFIRHAGITIVATRWRGQSVIPCNFWDHGGERMGKGIEEKKKEVRERDT